MSNNLNLLSATDAIKEIKAKHISAVELARSCAKQIERSEPEIKAWVCFDKENLIKQAQAIDDKIQQGIELSKLCGIPVGIKDIFNTADMPTCMGSPIWEGFTPGNDARAVEHIQWADGIIAGKTVTAEFAVHHPGPTVNPYNYDHSPGTSSGGSAAAVASNMVPLALGTQTAGSTIRPASYCGIYAMKPSFGLIPRTGILKTLDTLDHVTFFSRSVDDLHLMLGVLRVKGPNYPYVHKFVDAPSIIKKRDVHPWKVAFVKTPVWNRAETYAQDSIIHYVSKLDQQKGVILEEVELPEEFNSAHDVHELIYTKALSYYFNNEYENDKEKISETFCEMVEKGKQISAAQYMEGLEEQNKLTHQLDDFLKNYDIIITLSAAGDASRGLHTIDKKDSCLIWTLCYVPALNLPIFKSPNGLPFGAQIVSRRYRDYNLLNFARYLEEEGLLKHWKDNN